MMNLFREYRQDILYGSGGGKVKVLNVLKKKREYLLLLILAVLCILLCIRYPAFLRVNNLFDLLRSSSVYGIMAFGMLPVMITGGIDLSVSSTICLGAVLQAYYLQKTTHDSVLLVFLICIASGAAVGFINGILIARLQIPSFAATLSTQVITFSAIRFASKGERITDFSWKLRTFGDFKLIRIPTETGSTGFYIQILMLILMGAATWVLLRKTPVGRGICSVCSEGSSAGQTESHTVWYRIFAYVYCGMLAGIASVASVSMINEVDPGSFNGFEMIVITILFIGGASAFGGAGTVFGTSVAILLWAVLRNALLLLPGSRYWPQVVRGLILLLVILLDVRAHTRKGDTAAEQEETQTDAGIPAAAEEVQEDAAAEEVQEDAAAEAEMEETQGDAAAEAEVKENADAEETVDAEVQGEEEKDGDNEKDPGQTSE